MHDKLPKYSIVLPVRNGDGYVKDCIRSILSQSLPEFTLHVLDNNSNDGTAEWISSMRDNRIVIHPSPENLSMEENWGRIKMIPLNEFMTIIGHDDLLNPDYLAIMDKLIQKDPGASLYQCHFRFIDAVGKTIRSCKPMPESQPVSGFLKDIFTDSIDTMGTGYMMRAADYRSVGGIPAYPNLLFADHHLWLSLAAISYKATAAAEGFLFRLHQSVSKQSVAFKYITAFNLFMEWINQFQQKKDEVHDIIQKYSPGYIKYYCRSLSHRLLKTPVAEREGMTVDGFIRQCKKNADLLSPGNDFIPTRQFNIRLAKQIDNNALFRRIYLLFRKIIRKPIYS